MNSPSGAAGADVVVIGGGLHGLSSALHLARRGASLVVLERDVCGRLPELIGDDAGFVPSGQLKVAESEAELAACRARVAHLQTLGFTHEVMVDASTVRELVPSLARHVVGGVWAERDGHALPFRAVTALRLAAQHVVVNRAWAGLEGFMPDGIPVISRSATHDGLVHAFGFSAHGFELGPIVGSVVAELVCDGRSTHDIDAFWIGRFAATAAAEAGNQVEAQQAP
jgi:glycine/D-amino acid oxidase-like deaminating enzyme